ncbi:hypothetical protein EGW08_012537 [Elysia chlorotica]|uniref:Uncharacterized protein n=1 Tax=Elysia chlorotica TaxID=188477 RepID=A0A433TDW6_ELYCH|nr:hypothetical protein EGW08_012537 [Elysia chlorotica]
MPDDDHTDYKVLKRVLGEVCSRDHHKGVVTVEIPCDKLIPTDNRNLPKGGTCNVRFGPESACRSFKVKLELIDEKKKTRTLWNFELRRLPGPIDKQKSSWTIVKGMIVFKLHKLEENDDWTPLVQARGIDQLLSDESS